MVINQFNDPLFATQWHLLNTGQVAGIKAGIDINVVPVWADYTGRGVRVAILEGNTSDMNHPDLLPNYDPSLSFNVDNPTGNVNLRTNSGHATATAGIIGAAANNGVGGVGIAHNSTITNLQFDYRSSLSQAPFLFQRVILNGVDVISNSWGSNTPFGKNFGEISWRRFANGLESIVRDGRNGLGIVVAKSAGNGRRKQQWANGSNFINSPYTITVGGVGGEGDYRYSSSPGASVLVSAPTKAVNNVAGIVTTDIVGKGGYTTGDYTTKFSGTSASAPMVSGIAALMLEANPNLGYRDVQEILAYTSRRYILNQPAPGDSPWAENGAKNSNGGGLHYNLDYGFGLVDALAAVRLAETWEKQQVFANEQVIPLSTTTSTSGVDANGNSFIASEITVNSALELDHIQVNLDLKHLNTGELTVVLESPSGTRSTLINSGTVDTTTGTVKNYPDGAGKAYAGNSYKLSSTNFFGESAQGVWKITVTDTKSNSKNSNFNGWTLTVRGDAVSNNDTYIYTNEFANYTTDAARTTLVDASGIDTINAAAITSNINLDLNSGSTTSILAGNNLTIGNTTAIENAFGGDGSDRIWGNEKNNTLKGGRGNDFLSGRNGRDELFGNGGNDTINGGSGTDRLHGNSGNDLLWGKSGADSFVFEGLNLGIDTIADFNNSTEGDKIELSALGFGGGLVAGVLNATQFMIGSAATNAAHRIIYNATNGAIFFDVDGIGAQQQVQFATVGNNLALTSSDFIVV